MPPADPPPSDAWEGDRVARWLRESPRLERQMVPVSDVLFAAADLRPGERVLDVGCGTGPTTRQAAVAVGPEGAVTGLDISSELLDAAAAIPVEGPAAPITWTVADAARWDPGPPAYDVVLSRFGVMFFDDPTAAFGALARATVDGGRLALAVWGRRTEVDLFDVPLQAALGVLARRGIEPPSDEAIESGASSLADADATTALLAGAGWRDVAVTPHRLEIRPGGGLSPAEAAASALELGPATRAVAGHGDDVRAEAQEAIAAALADRADAAGHVVLDGAVRIVTARR